MAMKQIKVSEATGAALDWLVARAEGIPAEELYIQKWPRLVTSIFRRNRDEDGRLDGTYTTGPDMLFSRKWEAGGPIIDREGIFFSPLPDNGLRAFQFKDGQYLNIVDCWPYKAPISRLIVGMRCYVTSKLGDTAEVPEELL